MRKAYLFFSLLVFINPKIIVLEEPAFPGVATSEDTIVSGQAAADSLIFPEENWEPYDYVPDASYDLLKQRVANIENEIPLHFNLLVKEFINYFVNENREYTRRVIRRSRVYYPLFEKALARQGLPPELKHLAIVESALVPTNVSPAGAAGLWQLMTPTARQFGLACNEFIDDRMDPVKSTEAAFKLLKWLYRCFGDWELALAAYNSGYGNVKKALDKAGEKSFWAAYEYLPRETRSFIPQFVALTYVMNHQEEHNFYVEDEYQMATAKISITGRLDLEEFARRVNICYEDLKKVNPHIRQAIIPENADGVDLHIPTDLLAYTASAYASVINVNDELINSYLAAQRISYLESRNYIGGVAAPAAPVDFIGVKSGQLARK